MSEHEEKKYATPIPVDLDAYRASLPQPAGEAVVGTGVTDEVRLSAMIYKNVNARRSLTVHHLQRRLAELGYPDALLDRDGYYAENTKRAIEAFQADNGLADKSALDAETFFRIFDGDPNVTPLE